jgi:hypothetical protein
VAVSNREFRYDAFISYSHTDVEWVRGRLLPVLEESGFSVAIDFRDFRAGATGVEEMQRCVMESKRTIAVLSPQYVLSEWSKFENVMAQVLDPGAIQRRLMPILQEACDIPLRLKILQYRDVRSQSSADWALLIRDLM